MTRRLCYLTLLERVCLNLWKELNSGMWLIIATWMTYLASVCLSLEVWLCKQRLTTYMFFVLSGALPVDFFLVIYFHVWAWLSFSKVLAFFVCKFWYPVLKKVRTSNLQGSKRTQNIKLQRHIGDSKLVFFSHRIYIIFKKIAENSNCNPSLQSEIWGIFIFLFTVWYPGKLVSALN